jgi:SAM-dependent methyltransferase
MIACPRDRTPLSAHNASLECARGHSYPCVDGIPVLLVEDVDPTHLACRRSPKRARAGWSETLKADGPIDPYVSRAIEKTCGVLYGPLVGRLTDYPIPRFPLPRGDGAELLDVGCNWGRWTLAAAGSGYRAVGIDPALEAVAAARRVAAQLEREAEYVVADARHLPFPDGSFDVVFSYSVLQHFGKEDALQALREMGRVLRPGGRALVQMANAFGPRNLYRQIVRRRFREARGLFGVRYWTPGELTAAFSDAIGPAQLSVDGFFALNAQPSDVDLLPPRYRPVVRASELLRRASGRVPALRSVADSVYVEATKA